MIISPSLWPRIFRMATPIVIAMLTQTAINIMDTVMVGWLDPSYSIAGQSALGFSMPMLWLVGGFLSSVSIGTLAIVARRQGEKDYKLAGAALTNSVAIALSSSIILGMAAYLALPSIFRLLIDNDSVLAFGVPYARYRLLGVLSMVTTASIKSFFDGTSKTYVHMVAAIVMNIANVVLNYVLIFGVGPFPDMNVAGAGVASLVATYIGLAIMVGWTFVPSIRKKYQYYKFSDLNARTTWNIIRVSVPSGLANIFVMTGFLLVFKIVGLLDEQSTRDLIASIPAYASQATAMWAQTQNALFDQYYGLYSMFSADLSFAVLDANPPIFSSSTKVIVDILSVTFMSGLAFGTATASLVSQSLGEKNPVLAEKYAFESAKIAVALYGILAVITFLFPETIASLLTRDSAVIEVTAETLRMMAPALVIVACALIFTQALFGAGNTRFVMVVEMILHFGCLVPLAYLLGITFGFGIKGIWSATIVYATILCIVMGLKLKLGGWKKIEL